MSFSCACPIAANRAAGPGRTVRLYFFRGPGPDFSERDRAVLTLLRPHLHQAYLDAERRRHPVPRLTPRQRDLLRLLAAGHTNTQIARRLGISEGTVRTHLENIYDKAARLQPHRRRHPRLPRPDRHVGRRRGGSWSVLAFRPCLQARYPWRVNAGLSSAKLIACDARRAT